MNPRTPLELMLLTHYRTLSGAAEAIGVTVQAVRSWSYEKPANFLKYIREWNSITGTPFEAIIKAVTDTENRLNS